MNSVNEKWKRKKRKTKKFRQIENEKDSNQVASFSFIKWLLKTSSNYNNQLPKKENYGKNLDAA